MSKKYAFNKLNNTTAPKNDDGNRLTHFNWFARYQNQEAGTDKNHHPDQPNNRQSLMA